MADYVMTAETGHYALTGSSVTLTHFSPPPPVVAVKRPLYHFLGRFRLGQRINLFVIPPSPPDECPIVDVWLSGTSKKTTFQLPVKDRNIPLFSGKLFLNSSVTFPDGHYVATIRFTCAGALYQEYHYFEVIGGAAEGNVIAVTELRRPLGRAVIMQRDDGNVAMGYKPRVN